MARVELELQEVRRLDELRLERLADDILDTASDRVIARSVCATPSLRGLPLLAVLRAAQPPSLGTAALVFADRDAIHADRAADEEAGPREPEILTLEAVQPQPTECGDLQRLLLVERVLLQLFPVLVAPLQDAHIRASRSDCAKGVATRAAARHVAAKRSRCCMEVPAER